MLILGKPNLLFLCLVLEKCYEKKKLEEGIEEKKEKKTEVQNRRKEREPEHKTETSGTPISFAVLIKSFFLSFLTYIYLTFSYFLLELEIKVTG